MKFNIHITKKDGELLSTIEIDTEEFNWDTNNTANLIGHDILDEIKRAILREGGPK